MIRRRPLHMHNMHTHCWKGLCAKMAHMSQNLVTDFTPDKRVWVHMSSRAPAVADDDSWFTSFLEGAEGAIVPKMAK